MTSWTPWRFLMPNATLANSNGHINKIPHKLTEWKQCRSGASPILMPSHLRNGNLTHRILTLWFTAFGKFWRPGPVLSTTKIWRLWSYSCSWGGSDCQQKSCSTWPWIFRSFSEVNKTCYSQNYCLSLLSIGNFFLFSWKFPITFFWSHCTAFIILPRIDDEQCHTHTHPC